MIARKSALIFGMNVVGAVLGFATLKIIAVYMNVGIYGQVAFGIGILNFLSLLTGLGFDAAHVKRVSEGRPLGACVGTFALVKGSLTGLTVLVYVTALLVWTRVLDKEFVSTTEAVLVVLFLYGVFYSLRAVPGTTFDGLQQTAKNQIVVAVEHLVRVGATLVVGLAFAAQSTDTGPLAGSAVAEWPLLSLVGGHPAEALAATLALSIGASLAVGAALLPRRALGRPERPLLRSYAAFAVPMFTLSVIVTVSDNVDKVTLGFFWDELQVGYYYAVQRVHQLIMVVPLAVGTLLFPAFSGLHTEERYAHLRDLFRVSVRYISMVVLPPVVFAMVFPEALIHILLSDAWLPAAPVLQVLAANAFVLALVTPHVTLVQGMNRPGTAAKAGTVMALGNIALNFVFVPTSLFGVPMFGFAALGAGLATLIASGTGLALLMYQARVLVGARMEGRILLHVVAAGCMALVLTALEARVAGIARWYDLLLFGAIGLAVYLAVLAALREFGRTDLRFFAGLLHPGEMTKYIVSELAPTQAEEEKPL